MKIIAALFDQFRQTTDDQPAAILTLARVVAGNEATEKPLTVKKEAERLSVSSDTIYQLCEASKLKHQRIGNGRGTIRIRPVDLKIIQAVPGSVREAGARASDRCASTGLKHPCRRVPHVFEQC